MEESLVRRTDVVERTVNAAGEQKNQDSLSERIQEAFPGKRQMLESYSPLTLAYIGDAIYDLVIRTVVVGRANRPANILHHITVKYVSAGAQARIVTALQERFTQEERSEERRVGKEC